jgi:HD-like signal output (HDOD) protein
MSVDDPDDKGLYLCEREVMGFDHAAVGVALARNWGLPPALQECIEFHHEPERAPSHPLEAATIHVANSVAVLAEIDSVDLRDGPRISDAALRATKLNAASVTEIIAQTRETAEDVLALLTAA